MKLTWITATTAACIASAVVAQDTAPAPRPGVTQKSTATRVVRSNDGNQVEVFAFAEDGPEAGVRSVRPNLTLVNDLDGRFTVTGLTALDVSPHWIGLGCSPATEALRAQLGLTEGGVVVYDVVENGPAKAAGFQKHDVLTKAIVGEKEIALKDAPDLVQAVKAANLKPFKVEGIRAGKPITIEVTPVERPQANEAWVFAAPAHAGVMIDPKRVEELIAKNDMAGLKEYVQKQSQATGAGGALARLLSAGPVFAPPAAPVTKSQEVQDNVSISITRTGKEPAKIAVKRGSDEWNVTENELDKLPDDMRGQVQHMLHSMTAKTMRHWLDPKNQVRATTTAKSPQYVPAHPAAPVPMLPPGFPAPEDPFRGYQKQLEQQQKQLDAVLKQIEELKQALEKQAPKS